MLSKSRVYTYRKHGTSCVKNDNNYIHSSIILQNQTQIKSIMVIDLRNDHK